MPPAPLPQNEARRLEALRSCCVLDTPDEPAFDRLTALAADLLGVPICLISLVDHDRQWFKSRHGLAARETPRDQAFCAYAIHADEMLVIEDATLDERTRDNPLVTGPLGIRFYAGYPLTLEGGEVLGTLCAIDKQPRRIDAEQRRILSVLGEQVAKLLQMSQQSATLDRHAHEASSLRQALNEHTLFSVTDLEGTIIEVNEGFCRLSGYSREELVGQTHRLLNSGYHPKSFWFEMLHTISTGGTWRAEVCNRAKDGSIYWVDATNFPQRNERGEIDRYISLRFDITEKKIAEQRSRMLLAAFERSPDAMVVTDLEGRVRSANPAARELDGLLGHVPDPGEPALLFAPGRADPMQVHEIARAVSRGERYSGRVEIFAPYCMDDGVMGSTGGPSVTLHVGASPLVDDRGDVESFLFIKRDVSDEVRAAEAARLKSEGAEARARVGSILSSEAPLADRVEQVLEVVIQLDQLSYQRKACLFTLEDGDDRLRHFAHAGAFGGEIAAGQREVMLGEHLVGRAAVSGELIVSDDCREDEPGRHPHEEYGPHGHYVVPLMDEHSCVGVLCLYTDLSPSRSLGRVEALEQIGGLLASAIVRERHRETARRIAAETELLAGRLRVATEGAGVGIWELDQGTGSLVWDPTMYELYDVEPGTRTSYATWADALHPDDRERAEAELGEALEGSRNFDTQFRILRSDGQVAYIRASATVVRDATGVITRIVGANWDVSETARALDAMQNAQRIARMGSWSFDLETGSVVWSDQLYALFGREPALGPPDYEAALAYYAESDAERLRAAVDAAATDGVPFSLTMRTRSGHGGVRWIRGEGRVRRDRSGAVVGMNGTAMDVTVEVEREHALSEITTALDASNDSVFMFEADTLRFVYANSGAIVQFGYEHDEILRMTPVDIKPDFDEPAFRAHIRRLYDNPAESMLFRTVHAHRDGKRIPVEISLQLIEELGANGRFVAIVRDITEQLEAERRLTEAKESAEAANRAKSEFLANMSHEIRTPMTAILGYADLLGSDEIADPKQATEAVGTIQANANHLLTIVNDILDVSKIEAGQMTVESIETDPARIAEEVASLAGPRARGKGVEIRVRYRTPIPERIMSDPTRLRQILLNLVGNAIKFTEVGSVTVEVRCDRASGRMRFDVVDTGLGMTPEQFAVVSRFEAFSQADASMTRKFGGTGLGLRVSSGLAAMLGGGIEVESVEGEGSTFRVEIATGELGDVAMREPDADALLTRGSSAASPAAAAGGVGPTSLEGVRVLLAEDGPDNQRLISFHLKKAGASVTVCENGLVAVNTIASMSGDERPHVVLMDMQMPELDGYSASRRLRDSGFATPIIALTAHAMDGDREKCLAAGCDDYLTKPINKTELVERCARWASSGETRDAA